MSAGVIERLLRTPDESANDCREERGTADVARSAVDQALRGTGHSSAFAGHAISKQTSRAGRGIRRMGRSLTGQFDLASSIVPIATGRGKSDLASLASPNALARSISCLVKTGVLSCAAHDFAKNFTHFANLLWK